MESIINIEDRLRVVKAIFELSIEAKVFPDDIFIYTIYQKWDSTPNFRAESLALSMKDPRHKKTIKIISGLSTDILVLFDQLKKFLGELGAEYKYKIDCKPGANSLAQLYLVRWKWESESHDEFQFIDGEWFPYRGIINEDNSDFIFTRPLFLMFFVSRINQFLTDRILLDQQKENNALNSTLPPLPECFIDDKFWDTLLLDPRLQDYYEKVGNGKFRWIGKKNLLSGLAFKLLNKHKLIDSINSGQQLAKIFCSYFEVKFDLKDDRTFRPERALIDRFDWIN